MLKTFLNSLESPTHPLLGPNIRGLKITAILQPKSGLKKNLENLLHFVVVLFVVSQYVELWFIRSDLVNVLRNLSITMLSSVCVIKACTFIIWNERWKDILNCISELELKQMSIKDETTASIMQQYTKYSRFVTLFYWALVTATVITVDLAPLVSYLSDADYRDRLSNGLEPYPEIFSSWLPFDKTTFIGYFTYTLEHVLISFYGGGIIAAYDSTAVVLMNFFAGQLKILKVNCDRIFEKGGQSISDEEAIQRIRECHAHHVFLAEYSKKMDSLLSPVMFIYVVICSLMICSSVIQLTKEGTPRAQQVWISEYVIALVAQLFIYCWHSNEVLFMSREVDGGVYSSTWWARGPRVRRGILLLAGQLQKNIVFRAGPFTNLSVNAFVTILKGSYSFFTILNKNEK